MKQIIFCDTFISFSLVTILIVSAQVTSVWLTVAFTSDRYMMICHPFAAKRWCTVRLAKYIILSINLASLIYGIPRYFEYTELEILLPSGFLVDSEMAKTSSFGDPLEFSNQTGQRVVWYDLSNFGRSESFRKIYHLWSWNLLVVGIPLLTIAIMNSFLIREVRRSNSRGAKQNQRQEARRHETDVMLIGVIVIFFICQVRKNHFAFYLVDIRAVWMEKRLPKWKCCLVPSVHTAPKVYAQVYTFLLHTNA